VRSSTARTPLGGLRLVSQPRRHQRPWSEQLGRTGRTGAPRFQNSAFGIGAAIAFLLFALIILLAALQRRLIGTGEDD